MELKWTSKALSDLARLYEFLVAENKQAAAKTIQRLTKSPAILISNPRLGEQLFEFMPREVRRLVLGDYELRYEIQGRTLYLLRLWHTRETR